MEELERKELFIKYAKIIEEEKKQKSGEEFHISIDDKNYLLQIKNKYYDNPKYLELLEKIVEAPKGEAIQVVENFYKQYEQQQKEEKTPEEEIAKAFGLSTEQIKHLYLNNGKEIFFFYSASLERDIMLENDKNGKSITEILQKIQENDEKYQTENPDENANDIMMDIRLKSNIELKMYPPKEISQHESEVSQLTKNEKELLKYLINNAEELDIKEINIENLVYVTNNHEIKEVIFNQDYKPIVGNPSEEKSSSEEIIETGEIENNHDSSNELNDMLADDENISEYTNELSEEEDNKKEKEEAKKLVLKKTDEHGYVTFLLFIVTITSIITILVLALFR